MFHEQIQQSKDAQRKMIKYETETPWEYEYRKYRDTQAKAEKHSHYTAEEQIILNRYTQRGEGLLVLCKQHRKMYLLV